MNRKDLVYSKNFNPDDYCVRAILLYLIEMFKINPDLDFIPYEDDQDKATSFASTLFTTKFDWETKYKRKTPSVVISQGNTIYGVNNTVGNAKLKSVTENGQVTNYTDLISLPIMVECFAEASLEASSLASVASILLTADLRPLRSLGLQLQGNPIKTPPKIFEKGNMAFISSVIINVQMQRQYSARLLDQQRLDKILLKLNSSTEIDVKED